jgi:hypothetical protein
MKARIITVFVISAGIVAAVVFSSQAVFQQEAREHGGGPEPSAPETPVLLPAEDSPVYEGPLGDFRVAPGDAAEFPCESTVVSNAEMVRASELHSDTFREGATAASCADGTVVNISDYGDPPMGRRYFVGDAKVTYAAPRERLKLLEVDGKPAIAELPRTDLDLPGSVRLAVIERFPEEDIPGILVWIDSSRGDLETTAELASRLMRGER